MENNILGTEKVSKLIWRLSIPTILAQLINMVYNIVDRIYIGNSEGSMALSAIGVALPIIYFISAFASLICAGGAPRAAIAMGKKDNDGAERIMGTCFSTQIIVGIILTIVFVVFAEPILYLFGASDDSIVMAKEYATIYCLGTLGVQITLGMNMFITTQGFTKVSMMSVLIGAILNIILDPIFIFIFDMGVSGAALATIISQFVSCIWVISFLFGKKTILKLRKKYLRIDMKILLPCLALGLSPFIMQSTESILFVSFNTSLQKYGGDLAVASMTVLSMVMQFFMLPLTGFTQGAQPIMSYNFGAGNLERVKEAFKKCLIVCVSYSIFLFVFVEAFPSIVVKMFNSENNFVQLTSWALRIYIASGYMLGAQLACQQSFLALGNAKNSLILAIVRKIILLIPLIYIIPTLFNNDITLSMVGLDGLIVEGVFYPGKLLGVLLAEPVADLLAVITTCIVFAITFKKMLRKQVIE